MVTVNLDLVVIKHINTCGSYTGNGSTDGPEINLGWQPQWVLIKRSSGDVGDWYIFDSERGVVTGSNDQRLSANTSDAEQSAAVIDFTSTGFKITTSDGNFNGPNTIYMAWGDIRLGL